MMYLSALLVLVVAVLCYFLRLPPHASPVSKWPTFVSPINPTPLKIRKMPTGLGPETVIPSPTGLYVLTDDGLITYHSDAGGPPAVVADTGGRPLGGDRSEFDSTEQLDVLYVADVKIGLVKVVVSLPTLSSTVTIVSVKSADGRRVAFADDVAVDPGGVVYFSDATDANVDYVPSTNSYTTLSASIFEGMRGTPTGRVLRYSPSTGVTETVMDGIWFANGLTLHSSHPYLLACETFASRILKIPLDGSPPSVFAEGVFPGYVDGLTFSEDGRRVYVAVPSPAPAAVKLLSELRPARLNAFVRSIILKLPPVVKPVKYGCFVVLDAETGGVVRTYVDGGGVGQDFVTSVAVKGGDVYLGSLKTSWVAVLEEE